MLSSTYLILFTTSLIFSAAATVTSVRTITSTTYLPLEECCAQQATVSLGSMLSKPSASTSVKKIASKASLASSKPKDVAPSSATLSSPDSQCSGGPSILGADCSATQKCCPPLSCDVATLKCINPNGMNYIYSLYQAVSVPSVLMLKYQQTRQTKALRPTRQRAPTLFLTPKAVMDALVPALWVQIVRTVKVAVGRWLVMPVAILASRSPKNCWKSSRLGKGSDKYQKYGSWRVSGTVEEEIVYFSFHSYYFISRTFL